MTLSMEFCLTIVIQLLAVGIMIGVYKATIGFMQEQINDLKADMKRYNNILERMIRVEDSTKSAHHRIDSWEAHNVQI